MSFRHAFLDLLFGGLENLVLLHASASFTEPKKNLFHTNPLLFNKNRQIHIYKKIIKKKKTLHESTRYTNTKETNSQDWRNIWVPSHTHP